MEGEANMTETNDSGSCVWIAIAKLLSKPGKTILSVATWRVKPLIVMSYKESLHRLTMLLICPFQEVHSVWKPV